MGSRPCFLSREAVHEVIESAVQSFLKSVFPRRRLTVIGNQSNRRSGELSAFIFEVDFLKPVSSSQHWL